MAIQPYASLDKPYFQTDNIKVCHLEERPRGKLHIKRVFQFPKGSKEFNHIAELTYKLRADVNNGVLVKLTDSLKLPKVMEAGITLQNAQKFICPVPLHLVANLN